MTHRRTLIVAAILVALAASRASAQNPFFIDGNIADGNNSGVAPGATKTSDLNANVKELGPKNTNLTKIGVINSAPLPMLDTTNPNANVDLNTVYTQSKVVGTDLWFYFGWLRDSQNGSGFIAIELQRNTPPAACNYPILTEAQLIAGCNPWSGRQDGDFLLLWDQSGSSREISYRIYNAALGAFSPPVVIPSQIGVAVYGGVMNADTSRGEVAVNISAIVAGQGNQCLSFANIIPGTVTGNSDSADYKDTVLSKFPVASNCGGVTVTKVTLNGAGTPFTTDDSAGPFPFILTASTTPIFDGEADAVCSTSGASLNTCAANLLKGGSSVSVANLLNRLDYTLSEGAIPEKWTKVSIVCGSVDVYPGGNAFSVVAGETTTCTITNQLKQGKLQVSKTVINNNGGTLVAADFLLDIGVPGQNAFPGVASPGFTEFTLNDGVNFDVGEQLPAGYALISKEGCSGAIVANVTKVCVITNGDIPPVLHLVKVVENTAGGTATAASFTISADGPSSISGVGPTVNSGTGFLTGAYTLGESAVTGYSVKTDWSCAPVANVGTSITLALGQETTCTIVNQDAKATPSGLTAQRALLYDKLTITGIRPSAPTPGTVEFKVYTDAACTILAGTQSNVSIGTGGVAATTITVEVAGGGEHKFYWTAQYSGDAFNNGFTRGCGKEITTVNFQDDPGTP